ncbi:BCCT family transporter [Brevibacterium oceani]|uniref:BCCT family transporter n=1 Tax=Brevibacterium oceani TaxID=358099 RepID=UPI001B32924F|nr:BCCT family transporter [Brevibacterium oceani]
MKAQDSRVSIYVLPITALFVLVFVTWSIIFPNVLDEVLTSIVNAISGNAPWFYLVATAIFVIFLCALALSRYGRVRLGKDHEEPEFSRTSWFAMLFAAGMGIGLVFFGVAEPVSHLNNPPYGRAEAGSAAAAELGMRYTFFHWGLHLWAAYAVVALCIAYFTFRLGRSGMLSSAFPGLMNKRSSAPIGDVINILGILSTMFGVAVSFGLGALQINGGLNYLFGVPVSPIMQILIIVVITIVFTISAISGVARGIRILSNINIVLAIALMLLILVIGATVFSSNIFFETLGGYIHNLLPMSLDQNAFDPGQSKWAQDQTLFYFANAIAWSPFVGTFIARVSRGRTIREFVIVVLILPSLACFAWFSIFGGTALNIELGEGGGIISRAVENDVTTALFITLDQLPLSTITSLVAIVLVSVFFITSADSGTFVLASMSTGGSQNPKLFVKLIWAIAVSAVASVTLLSGGINALQNLPIAIASPLTLIVLAMCFSLYRTMMREEPRVSTLNQSKVET